VGIETPYQIALLTGVLIFTVFSIAFVVRLWLRQSRPTHSSSFLKVVIGLSLLLIALCTSLLFYQALTTGETYCLHRMCRGSVVEASGEPIGYWLLVAIWYLLAWLSSSASIFTLLRPNQPSW